MSDVRQALARIAALPLRRKVRVLNLCGDHERVITLSEMRRLLPREVDVVPGPGCAATLCPQADIHQAMSLVAHHDVTLLVDENLLRMPLVAERGSVDSLYERARQGADIRGIEGPAYAVHEALQRPDREHVYFVAGFETLLAPLAGMILEGLPTNLSVLVCGRRAEPLIDSLLAGDEQEFDALLLPGNRCAVTGLEGWDGVARRHHKPAAVAGYSTANILAAIHAVLVQHANGAVRVDNFYRGMVRTEGNGLALDHLDRVFERVEGEWRGFGRLADTGYRLRHAYDDINADRRFPDYRDAASFAAQMPDSCCCGDVLGGRRMPPSCPQFAEACTPINPLGPCMASADGTCFLHRSSRT